MKWKKITVLLLTIVCTSHQSPAQLLKKLKEKAEKAVEGKTKSKSENSSDDSSSSSPSSSSSSSSAAKSNAKEPATAPGNGTVVFSLNSDEQLLYDETAVFASNTGVSYQFIVKNSKYEYFLIDNGNRSGPFKNPPLKSANVSSESSSETNDVAIGDKKDETAIQYTKTIGGKLHIVFNGKNYGPYDHVSKMVVSPDKKTFFASVTIGGANNMTTKMGMGNSYIVSSTGIKQKAGSSNTIPMKFYVSDGFKQAMLGVMEQTDQKMVMATSAGKQMEVSMADMYSGGENKTLVSDKGDIISIPSQSPRQILVNGEEAASFKVPLENISRLFITPDVSKSVYYDKGKLFKADGTEVSMSGIVFPKVVTVGNITSVYYFKVFKNENGIKDVYLCKKEI